MGYENIPVTSVIDSMDYGEERHYFLRAERKKLYERVKHNGNIALTAIKGKTRETGSDILDVLSYKNPYMENICPTVLKLFAGRGEWFDLSKRPIAGSTISAMCNGCGHCISIYPEICMQKAVERR